jgi:hypothetical protein
VYGEECLLRTSVFEWHERFKEGRELLQDHEWKGRPSTSRTEESMEVIQKCLAEDQTLSVWMLEEMTGISRETVHKILDGRFEKESGKAGPGIFWTTMHWRILRPLSPSFWLNKGSPYYPIHPTPFI